MRCYYVETPIPHLRIDEIVPPEVYSGLRFPDELVDPGVDWGITASDPAYAAVLEDPGWRALHDELCGEAFVHTVLDTFSEAMREEGCLVEAERARLIPFVESREQKELGSLELDGEVHEIFTRLDFQAKGEGAYRDFVHLDWARRIVGGILFFSDAEEEGLEGGELAFYRDRDFRNDRWCHEPELTATFAPRHNSGVIFLNANRCFHGPRAITRLAGRRRWLYYTISSRLDVWPAATRSAPVGSARLAAR